jgi:flagellar FliL protein
MAMKPQRTATVVKAPLKPVATPAAAAPAQPNAKAEAPKKRSKRGLLVIVTLAVLMGGGGTAAWMYMEAQKERPGAAPPAEKPVFVNLEQFTVNLQPEVTEQFLQLTLVVKVTDDATAEAIRQQMPEIRNRLLLLMSGKKPSELMTTEGKRHLSGEILAEVKVPLPADVKPRVSAAFFTAFVIQ